MCRWGGEEILVMLPQCNKDTAAQIAERIAEGIRKILIVSPGGVEVRVTMTFGVAGSDEWGEIKDIVKGADNRLYYGKEHGKDCVIKEDVQ